MSFVRTPSPPPSGKMPSQREMTMRNTELNGPKSPRRIRPEDHNLDPPPPPPQVNETPAPVFVEARAAPVVEAAHPPSAPAPSPPSVEATATAPREPGPRVVPPQEKSSGGTAFICTATPPPAASPPRLPSQRESTLRQAEENGPKAPARVRPEDLPDGAIRPPDVENTVFSDPQPRAGSAADSYYHPTKAALERADCKQQQRLLAASEAQSAAEEGESDGFVNAAPASASTAEGTPPNTNTATNTDTTNTSSKILPQVQQQSAPLENGARPSREPPAGDLASLPQSKSQRLQSGLRPNTKSPAYIKAEVTPDPPQYPLSQLLPPRPEAEPIGSKPGQMPSQREMTIRNVEQFGKNDIGNHVRPEDLPEGPTVPEPAASTPSADTAVAASSSAVAAARPEHAAPVSMTDAPVPAPPTPAPRPPSQREMTICNTEQFGATAANRVPPSELPLGDKLTSDVYHKDLHHAEIGLERPAPYVPMTEPLTGITLPRLPSIFSWTAAAAPEAATSTTPSTGGGGGGGLDGVLPPSKGLSQREMTIVNTERWGSKSANHVPPSQLPLSQRLTSDVRTDAVLEEGNAVAQLFGRAKRQLWGMDLPEPIDAAIDAAADAATTTTTAVEPVAAEVSAAAAAPAFEVLLGPDGRMLSQREMTIASTERWGPKGPNHIPPEQLAAAGASAVATAEAAVRAGEAAATTGGGVEDGGAAVAKESATSRRASIAAPKAAGTSTALTTSTATTTTTTAGGPAGGTATTTAAAGATALFAKPVSEWTGDDLKSVGRAALANPLFMSIAAVGAAALTVFSIYKGAEMYNRHYLNRCLAEVEAEEPATVHLYIMQRSPLAPSVSVRCSWVETFLRVAQVPYEAHAISDPSVSPSGQLPFIIHRRTKIAGAVEIVQYIRGSFGVDVDAHLTSEARATGAAMLSTLEYSLNRGYTRSVFLDRPEVIRPYYSEINATPDWLTRLALQRMASRIQARDKTTGYSFYSRQQASDAVLRDMQAFESLLTASNFLFSDDRPSSFDCALYAWLLPVVAMESSSAVNDSFKYIVRSRVLVRFVKEMTAAAFPDFEDIIRDEFYLQDVSRGGSIAGGSPHKAFTFGPGGSSTGAGEEEEEEGKASAHGNGDG